jgi:acetylornithine deacetylase/succinyl-diaminopimelate desuccinylase-like protein
MSVGLSCQAYARPHRSRFVAEPSEFVRFASISAQPQHTGDVRNRAMWLATHLRNVGLDRVEIVPTRGHPIVYGEWLRAPGRPTVLVYGRYDVQPVDPIEQWHSPPFEPAPNEKFRLPTFFKAIATSIHFLILPGEFGQGRLPTPRRLHEVAR